MVDRAAIVAKLITNGTPSDIANLYADQLCEYASAQQNIARHGAVIISPRTGDPIDNPLLKVRDRSMENLKKLRNKAKIVGVWELIPPARPPEG